MASSSPQHQSTIGFPRRRSARRLAAAAPLGKSGPDPGSPDPGSSDLTAVRLSPCPRAPGTHSARTKVLPLSPCKRLGDDNLCNVPYALPSSPAKRSKENQGRRLLFGDPLTSPEKPSSPGPSPRHRGQETPRSLGLGRQPARARLFRQEGTCYQQVKRALHAAVPDRLYAREKETGIIRQFLREHVCGRQPGSLYVSGAPGTGKTACLSRVLLDCKDELTGSKTIVLNCMSLSSPQGIFPTVAQQLGLPAAAGREGVRRLEKQLTAQGPMVLLVLDELDQLESKGQDVLYTLFEWPRLPGSRLVLVGLANALDLTDRSLARLGARPAGSPQLLHFPPYTREQLTAILQERLGQVAGDPVLDAAALQFCARKVSAVSGDARKALDVCRRAVEVVELEVRSQTLLKPLPGGDSPASPVPKRVGLLHVSRVISEVFGDRLAGGGRGTRDAFPLQQKVLLCSLLLLARHLRSPEVTLGKLHDAYGQVCRRQQLPAVDQAECLSLVTLLESRGVLELKKAKEARLAKVSLKMEEAAVEHALQDAALVGSILAQGLR
ncbi:LOW QUALITY PROTEIN: cell division control protein 6 homolog [Aquila chrysaetos chrysaetos]|uniref:LOW QUALITY PROTEIN: cell division control protein 6 homolog n=1 Tax=Aquila chrysaetos chrysaetos TaxID=223781 RepID=UPI0011771594|nr:LOW QUALITY PROTEIN: cell division control protein 6 homolog [Aquila chrysaetos chrysaetos]